MAINYNPNINPNAGYVTIGPGNPQLSRTDGNTLLRLLHWVTYVREGRDFLKTNRLGGALTEEQIAANFRNMLTQEFGLTDEGLQDALISAHLAADRYITAKNAASGPEMNRQDKIYQQNISFVMWTLWENAMAHEFSMNW
jgi:hypothetical protein